MEQQVDTNDLLASAMVAHRILKSEKAGIDIRLNTVRQTIQELVEELGNYTDDIGYARLQQKSAYDSYPAREITRVARIWAMSRDPILAQCGEILCSLATTKAAKTVLVVK